MVEIDLNNFEESLVSARAILDKRKKELLKIVNPFLTDDLDRKKQIELCHIAKLILYLNENLKIIEMRESPDFLLSRGDKKIGVEIRQLKTKRVESINYIQNLFTRASQEFSKQFPDLTINVNFWLNQNFRFTKQEKSKLVKEIIEYIHNETKHIASAKPSFIDHIDIHKHSEVSFYYNEGAYSQEILANEIVLNAIVEKEAKIESYIDNSGTEFQWLLLINSEVGSDSFDTNDFEGIDNLRSRFEHIFLLRDLDLDFVKIK